VAGRHWRPLNQHQYHHAAENQTKFQILAAKICHASCYVMQCPQSAWVSAAGCLSFIVIDCLMQTPSAAIAFHSNSIRANSISQLLGLLMPAHRSDADSGLL
jgi:hypothetical protein